MAFETFRLHELEQYQAQRPAGGTLRVSEVNVDQGPKYPTERQTLNRAWSPGINASLEMADRVESVMCDKIVYPKNGNGRSRNGASDSASD